MNPYELLTSAHYRLLLTLSLIATFGLFDFMAFWYSADTIVHLFFSASISDSQRYFYIIATFAAGYLARPIGGWLLGHYGDRYGRKPALLLGFLAVSLFTLIIAILPTYAHIGALATVLFVLARLGQGVAFGSQLPTLWVYATEQLPSNSIGFGCGLVTATAMAGGFLVVALLYLLENSLTQSQMLQFGWRLPFLFGATFGLMALMLGKDLPEKRPKRQRPQLPLVQRWQGIFCVVLLSGCMSSVATVITVLLPDLVQMTFVLKNGLFAAAFLVCLGFLVLGCLLFGFLTDRVNAGLVMVFGCVGFVLAFYWLFYDLATGGAFVLATMALTGLFAGVIGAMPAVMARLCPAQHRLRTVAVGYNGVYALTGLTTPLLLGFLTYYADFAPVVYLSFVCLLTIFFSFYVYYQPRPTDIDR